MLKCNLFFLSVDITGVIMADLDSHIKIDGCGNALWQCWEDKTGKAIVSNLFYHLDWIVLQLLALGSS